MKGQEIIKQYFRRVSKANKRIPEYELTGTKGPDHNKVFEVSVKHNNRTIGHGVGKSKKEAEKKAAKEALNYIKRKK